MTIALKSVPNPLEFGIVVVDDKGRVERFLEKPSWGQVFSDTINTGVYVLEPEVLEHVPSDRPFDFSKELFPLLLEMGRPIYGLPMDGYWAGHREPRPVPAGEFRRARRARRARRFPASACAGTCGWGRGWSSTTSTRSKGPALISNYCRIGHDAHVGPYSVLSASVTLRERARTVRSVVDASTHIGRGSTRRGGDRRPLVRHPRARPAPGRGRDRRRGQDRRGERAHARRPRLSEQGGGERRPDLREPDLGVPRVLAPVREGRRRRPRQRRPHARDGLAAGGRVRNRASARRPHRGEPGGARDLPHDRALDDRGNQLDRRGRRRPADASERSGAASSEDARLRRRLPCRLQLRRPGSRPDPLLRGSRDPDHSGAPEGDREAFLAR